MPKFQNLDITWYQTRYGKMVAANADQVIGHSIRTYGEWAEHEIQSICNLIDDGGIIIDVGANIGTHTVALASRLPKSIIYAFEPQPLVYPLLAANIIENRLENVRLFNLGCSNKAETIGIGIDYEDFNWNMGSINLEDEKIRKTKAHPVCVVKADEILPHDSIRFIKIDAEGMECKIIEGLTKVIELSRPKILIEFNDISALPGMRRVSEMHNYDMFLLQTSAYNKNNFNNYQINVWDNTESSMLMCPRESSSMIGLHRLNGDEQSLPRLIPNKFEYSGDQFYFNNENRAAR